MIRKVTIELSHVKLSRCDVVLLLLLLSSSSSSSSLLSSLSSSSLLLGVPKVGKILFEMRSRCFVVCGRHILIWKPVGFVMTVELFQVA